jgi:hypothetical protein
VFDENDHFWILHGTKSRIRTWILSKQKKSIPIFGLRNQWPTTRHKKMPTMTMKIFGSILLVATTMMIGNNVVVVSAAFNNGGLRPQWTTPRKVGETVPDVTFLTRTRIESNDPNPFDWKRTFVSSSIHHNVVASGDDEMDVSSRVVSHHLWDRSLLFLFQF